MNTATTANPVNYLNAEHGLLSWLLTKDHKRIAILYLLSSRSSSRSGALRRLIRIELLTPQGTSCRRTPTMPVHHARVAMVFFFLIRGSGRARELPRADHDRRPRPRLPGVNLLSCTSTRWRLFTLIAVLAGGIDTG